VSTLNFTNLSCIWISFWQFSFKLNKNVVEFTCTECRRRVVTHKSTLNELISLANDSYFARKKLAPSNADPLIYLSNLIEMNNVTTQSNDAKLNFKCSEISLNCFNWQNAFYRYLQRFWKPHIRKRPVIWFTCNIFIRSTLFISFNSQNRTRKFCCSSA